MSSACSAKRYADFRVVRAVPEQSKWPRRVVFLFAFTFDVDYATAAQAVLDGGAVSSLDDHSTVERIGIER